MIKGKLNKAVKATKAFQECQETKTKMSKEETVYRILNKETGKHEGVYSRAYHDEYDFNSVESARCSNCHGIYQDKSKYKIQKYKVTYTLIEDDV